MTIPLRLNRDGKTSKRENKPLPVLTQIVPLVFGVLVDVFLGEATEKNAVETRVKSVQVGAAHVTDAGLGLGKGDRAKRRAAWFEGRRQKKTKDQRPAFNLVDFWKHAQVSQPRLFVSFVSFQLNVFKANRLGVFPSFWGGQQPSVPPNRSGSALNSGPISTIRNPKKGQTGVR